MKMLMLFQTQAERVHRGKRCCCCHCYNGQRERVPHPFADRETLQGKVLRPLESEEKEVEDCAEPVELVLVDVRALTGLSVIMTAMVMENSRDNDRNDRAGKQK